MTSEGALQAFVDVLADYPYFADVHNKAGSPSHTRS
jgi:hypothetical protein